jgi:hypothetical protein
MSLLRESFFQSANVNGFVLTVKAATTELLTQRDPKTMGG